MQYNESDIRFAFKILILLIVLFFGLMNPRTYINENTKKTITLIEKVKIPTEVKEINASKDYFTARVKYNFQ